MDLNEVNLDELTLEITKKCPLNCSICSSDSCINPSDPELDRDAIKDLINEACNLGLKTLAISGGEPLVCTSTPEIVHYAKEKGLEVHIYSCGNILYNNNLIPINEGVFESNRISEADKIIFSIHGANSQTHDRISRTPGSYDNLIKSVEFSINNGINTELHFVPLKENYKELPEIIKNAKDQKVNSVSVLRFVPQGRGKENQSTHELSQDEIQELKSELKQALKKYNAPDEKIDFIRLGSPFNCFNFRAVTPCTAGITKATVKPNGQVVPCVSMKWYPDDKGEENIKNTTFREIWEKGKSFVEIREYLQNTKYNPKDFKDCRRCCKYDTCHSGCFTHKKIGGDIHKRDPYCPHSSIELKINDNTLITWLRDNSDKISFLNDGVPRQKNIQDSAKKYIQDLKKDDHLYKQLDIIKPLWKDLLSNAIIYLKSKDTREIKHDEFDYGVKELEQYMNNFEQYQGLLFGSDKKYRDHISHMFCVYLVGAYVVNTFPLKYNSINVGNNKQNPEYTISAGEKEAMWCIMALTHDLGYPLKAIKKINEVARNMLDKFGIQNFQELSFNLHRQPLYDFIIKFISSDLVEIENPENDGKKKYYLTHPQSKYFLKFSWAFENYKHGLFSSIVLMKNLVYFLESDYSTDIKKPLDEEDAKQFLIRNTILRSIAAHNCEDIYFLNVMEFPFLLTVFDEMHEWNRPQIDQIYGKYTPDRELIIKSFDEDSIDYSIKIKYNDKDSADSDLSVKEKKDKKEKIKKEFETEFYKTAKSYKRRLRSALGERAFSLKYSLTLSLRGKSSTLTYCDNNPEEMKIFHGDTCIEPEIYREQMF